MDDNCQIKTKEQKLILGFIKDFVEILDGTIEQ